MQAGMPQNQSASMSTEFQMPYRLGGPECEQRHAWYSFTMWDRVRLMLGAAMRMDGQTKSHARGGECEGWSTTVSIQ